MARLNKELIIENLVGIIMAVAVVAGIIVSALWISQEKPTQPQAVTATVVKAPVPKTSSVDDSEIQAYKQKIADKKAAEAKRIADERAKIAAEKAKLAAEAKRKQQAAEKEKQRLAQERQRLEKEKQQAKLAAKQEKQRIAKERKALEAEKQRQAEITRKKAEAEKKRQAEITRKKAEAEKKRQAEIARKAEAEKKRKAEIARKAEAEKKRKAEIARKAEAEKKRKAEIARKKAEAEKKRQAEIARKKAEAERKRIAAELAADISAREAEEAKAAEAAAKQQAITSTGLAIKNKINSRWVVPAKLPQGLRVKLAIKLSPGGKVLGTPRIVNSSGYRVFDNSAIEAVRRASPLPLPNNKAWAKLFTDDDLIVNFP